MLKFVFGFLTASVCFSLLLYIVEMPEYITYDCRELDSYEYVPEQILKACSKVKKRDEGNWIRVTKPPLGSSVL
jgi:hypothetical protein